LFFETDAFFAIFLIIDCKNNKTQSNDKPFPH